VSAPGTPPPASPSTGSLLLLPLRVGLGLFVIWQVVFLISYNLVDVAKDTRKYLKEERQAWLQHQDKNKTQEDKQQGKLWDRAIHLPLVGDLIVDWVEKEDSRVQREIDKIKHVTTWYAKRAGLEQGWGLFAPNTGKWTCLVAVELRWDDDPEPLGEESLNKAPLALAGMTAFRLHTPVDNSQPEPIELYSNNEPRDIHRYVRWGLFRQRKYEGYLEVGMRPSQYSSEENAARDWEELCREKISSYGEGEGKELLLYLRWKLRKFMEKNSELPPPRQVILRCRCWSIPKPPLFRQMLKESEGDVAVAREKYLTALKDFPRGWDWISEGDRPVARWRPWRNKPRNSDVLEVYLHTLGRFESHDPTRLHPHIPPLQPWSAD
jgi:hypothetical protein